MDEKIVKFPQDRRAVKYPYKKKPGQLRRALRRLVFFTDRDLHDDELIQVGVDERGNPVYAPPPGSRWNIRIGPPW
jgi:hypothetical protein